MIDTIYVGMGVIGSYIHENRIAVLVELSFTDPGNAGSPELIELANNLAMQVAADSPLQFNKTQSSSNSISVLLGQSYIKNCDISVTELISHVGETINDQIEVVKFVRYEIKEDISRIQIPEIPDDQAKLIDDTLLLNLTHTWRKSARVIGTSMSNLAGELTDVPDIAYAIRLKALVDEGIVECQGDIRRIRFSEVRIPGN